MDKLAGLEAQRDSAIKLVNAWIRIRIRRRQPDCRRVLSSPRGQSSREPESTNEKTAAAA